MRRSAALVAALLVAVPAAVVPAVVVPAVVMPAVAVADGDPASDVLLGQAVFMPYAPISHALQGRLYALTSAAAARGYPVRVALIAAPTDLGVVPILFDKPAAYARFLSSELAGPVTGTILVVMPHGFGLARAGRDLDLMPLAGLAIGGGTEGLATAALAAIPRLAAAAGHRLPAGVGAGGATAGASAGTVRHALRTVAVMTLLAAAAIGCAWRARGRAARTG